LQNFIGKRGAAIMTTRAAVVALRPGYQLLDIGVTEVNLRFDIEIAKPFFDRSNSEETRRAYKRVVREFFYSINDKHPTMGGHNRYWKSLTA
jgi:hypothetical protein